MTGIIHCGKVPVLYILYWPLQVSASKLHLTGEGESLYVLVRQPCKEPVPSTHTRHLCPMHVNCLQLTIIVNCKQFQFLTRMNISRRNPTRIHYQHPNVIKYTTAIFWWVTTDFTAQKETTQHFFFLKTPCLIR